MVDKLNMSKDGVKLSLADYRKWVLSSTIPENKVSFWCRVKCFFIMLKEDFNRRSRQEGQV